MERLLLKSSDRLGMVSLLLEGSEWIVEWKGVARTVFWLRNGPGWCGLSARFGLTRYVVVLCGGKRKGVDWYVVLFHIVCVKIINRLSMRLDLARHGLSEWSGAA